MDSRVSAAHRDHGRTWIGIWDSNFRDDHQVSGFAIPGEFWRFSINVRYTSDHTRVISPRKIPAADSVQSDNPIDRDIPLRVPWGRVCGTVGIGVQFCIHARDRSHRVTRF